MIFPLILCAGISLIYAEPQTSELPNYPRNYRPQPFTSKTEIDRSTAASQSARTYIDNPYLYQNQIPIRQKPIQQARPGKNSHFKNEQELDDKQRKELEEEELEEPDRLSLLLPNSKFSCSAKNTGYYADEELGCEVFHYCQDNAKHSWICPEGFTFHQVHLICMPPGGDNICEKSSQYHFVNEYLYKPVNLEEFQQKPNISLRYHERFYPSNYYDEGENEEQQQQQEAPHRHSVRVQQAVPVARSTFRPETTLNQVFRSSNDVNIPLQQRRPQYVTPSYFD